MAVFSHTKIGGVKMKLLIGVVLGAVIGAVIGYVGKCTTGTCPLTSNPYLGAFFGAVIGILAVSLK